MVSNDFLLISWRDLLYSAEGNKKKMYKTTTHIVCEHIFTFFWFFTFGMVFVQLISCLFPFLYPVLEWCNQAFQEDAAASETKSSEEDQGWKVWQMFLFIWRKKKEDRQVSRKEKVSKNGILTKKKHSNVKRGKTTFHMEKKYKWLLLGEVA